MALLPVVMCMCYSGCGTLFVISVCQGVALFAGVLWTVTLVLAIAHFCEYLYRKQDEHEDQEDDDYHLEDGQYNVGRARIDEDYLSLGVFIFYLMLLF